MTWEEADKGVRGIQKKVKDALAYTPSALMMEKEIPDDKDYWKVCESVKPTLEKYKKICKKHISELKGKEDSTEELKGWRRVLTRCESIPIDRPIM